MQDSRKIQRGIAEGAVTPEAAKRDTDTRAD